jgi:3-oxoisoapionate decarboxylase
VKLGISSYTYGWGAGAPGFPPPNPLTPMDLLHRARELGVHVLQVCDNCPLDPLGDAELDEFMRLAAEWEIDIEVGTRGIAPDLLRRYLALALRTGSPFVRTVVDTKVHHPSAREVVETFRSLMPEFEGEGVYLAVENHDRFTASALVELLVAVDSPFIGVCLDTTNSFGALEGPGVVVNALAPWTLNVHVKDFVVRRAAHSKGFVIEGRPAGQGDLDIPWMLDIVGSHGRDPNAIIELWTPYTGDVAETIEKEKTWAEESVRHLRALIPD